MVKITKFILFNTHHYNKMQDKDDNYTKSFPIIEGSEGKKAVSSGLSLSNMKDIPMFSKMFDRQSGEVKILYVKTNNDKCLIEVCNLYGSNKIKITYLCNNIQRSEIHLFDPSDFSVNVNKYLLTEEELEDQKRVLADCEFVGYT